MGWLIWFDVPLRPPITPLFCSPPSPQLLLSSVLIALFCNGPVLSAHLRMFLALLLLFHWHQLNTSFQPLFMPSCALYSPPHCGPLGPYFSLLPFFPRTHKNTPACNWSLICSPPALSVIFQFDSSCLTPNFNGFFPGHREYKHNTLHFAIWFLFLTLSSPPSWSLLSILVYYWVLCINKWWVILYSYSFLTSPKSDISCVWCLRRGNKYT